MPQSSAVSRIVVQTFNANGTYTPSANLLFCSVKVKGAGGGGGGAQVAAGSKPQVGGGGGEGATTTDWYNAAQIGSAQTVIVGIRGLGGNSTVDASNGTASTFGALLTANGGNGGATGLTTNADQRTPGGDGGIASGGTENLVGAKGDFGHTPGTSGGDFIYGGAGGGLGGGAPQLTGGAGANGFNATNPGTGGGGAVGEPNVGGNGANGFVYIVEYIHE